MARPENVFVYWPISCFDKRRVKPLPVCTRFYLLDEAKATDAEKQAILKLIHENDVPTPDLPPVMGQTMETISFGASGCDRRVLKYRHLFRECTAGELQAVLDCAGRRGEPVGLESISLMGRYFEDENGVEISETEMVEYVAGGRPVVIPGNPESVIQLGPAGMCDPGKWSVETANTLAHFFEVVDLLASSTWYRSPLSMTTHNRENIVSATFPSVHSALGILVLLRQMYSSHAQDNLFNRACSEYVRHVADQRKRSWVQAEKKAFNRLLSEQPWPGPVSGGFSLSTRELLETFLYGAGLIHSRGQKGKRETFSLAQALKSHPRELLVMSFHSGMKQLLGCALTVYPVLRQDFLHWVNTLGVVKPDRVSIAALLAGTPPTAIKGKK